MSAIVWTDVSPRDGLQNIDETVDVEVKRRLIAGLLGSGLPRVEATSFVSPRWVPQLADAAAVLAAFDDAERGRLRVLIPNLRGLELALEHGVSRVLVTVGATDSFNRRNINRPVAQSLEDIDAILAAAQTAGCTVDVAVSVAFGCPFEGAVDPHAVIDLCTRLANAGVEEVGVADTIGVATPDQVTQLCSQLLQAGVPDQRLSLHVHDTRGQGVANVVAAYSAGIRRFDGSAGGLGGCPFAPRSTGNVCSEDALLALEGMGAEHGVDLGALCAVSATLAHDLGRELPGKLYRAGLWDAAAITAQQEG